MKRGRTQSGSKGTQRLPKCIVKGACGFGVAGPRKGTWPDTNKNPMEGG